MVPEIRASQGACSDEFPGSEKSLTTTGLVAWELHLNAQRLEEFEAGHADGGLQLIDETGDEECDSHRPAAPMGSRRLDPMVHGEHMPVRRPREGPRAVER